MYQHEVSVSRGSPPRGRGKVPAARYADFHPGITPAWAGKRGYALKRAVCTEDHPRVGGEKEPYSVFRLSQQGSPPHGRGKDGKFIRINESTGITPAQAGKSILSVQRDCPLGDHPRVGGEKPLLMMTGLLKWGSPPRGRGEVRTFCTAKRIIRITPA